MASHEGRGHPDSNGNGKTTKSAESGSMSTHRFEEMTEASTASPTGSFARQGGCENSETSHAIPAAVSGHGHISPMQKANMEGLRQSDNSSSMERPVPVAVTPEQYDGTFIVKPSCPVCQMELIFYLEDILSQVPCILTHCNSRMLIQVNSQSTQATME